MNIIEIIRITAELLSAMAVIGGVVFACYRWFLKQKKQDDDIKQIKEENTLICFGLQACLDGLQQLGANHSVTTAKEKLEKHLNQWAHK